MFIQLVAQIGALQIMELPKALAVQISMALQNAMGVQISMALQKTMAVQISLALQCRALQPNKNKSSLKPSFIFKCI